MTEPGFVTTYTDEEMRIAEQTCLEYGIALAYAPNMAAMIRGLGLKVPRVSELEAERIGHVPEYRPDTHDGPTEEESA